MTEYPFVPKTSTELAPGQFWSIPLSDGRFACGQVLYIDESREHEAGTTFVGLLLNWTGKEPPTAEAIAGRLPVDIARTYVGAIGEAGGSVLGESPLWNGMRTRPKVPSGCDHRYPALQAEQRFVRELRPPRYERRRVGSPLTEEMLLPARTGQGVVELAGPLTEDDSRRLGDWLGRYPDMALSVGGTSTDLEFLRFFPLQRRLTIASAYALRSLDGLRHLPDDLETLHLGESRQKLDLSPLARFGNLKSLWLDGHSKHIEALASLTSLEELSFRSITLPDLSLLLPMTRLLSLEIKLGGTADIRLLPQVGQIRYLELWRIKGLSDISAIGEMPHLRSVFLQTLKHVETIPDLNSAVALRRVYLETMKGIRDLRPLASAPALEEIALIDMPQLQPNELRPLVGLPHLKAVTAGLCSQRKNDTAEAMFGLPRVSGPFDWRKD
ncbi:MAG TPA: hypothetical protein VF337_01955 [Candidatus Limnocylindrales bacterium]